MKTFITIKDLDHIVPHKLLVCSKMASSYLTLECVLQGDAVFWYNLKRSGKGDYETENADCPVLCGNKWGE